MDKNKCEHQRLSRYVEVIEYGNKYILFNKINSGIVVLDGDKVLIEGTDTFVTDMKIDDLRYLSNEYFFVNEEKVQKYIKEKLSFPQNSGDTDVTISVTETCNLKCEYCYQSDWDRHEKISDTEYLHLLKEYFQFIIPLIHEAKGCLRIHFIGGEPLVKKDLLLQIKGIIEAVNIYGIDIYYLIDTNLMLLTREFLEQFSNMAVHTTLTAPEDHNKLRTNSYEVVLSKLKECAEIFDNQTYKLTIRYNVHHNNISELESVIELLENMNLKFVVEVANIMNTEGADFKNELTEEMFDAVYLEEVVDVLERHGQDSDILPQYGLSRHCSAWNKLNCKFYTNGNKVLCNAIKKNVQLREGEYLPILPESCVKCYDFPYCGGPKLCEEVCKGKFLNKENVLKRILKYVQMNYEQ